MPLPRRFRSFSLRTLMVLVTLVCVVLGWLFGEWRFIQGRRAFLNGSVDARVFAVSGRHLQSPLASLRQWLGDWRVEWIEFRNPDTDPRVIRRTAALFPEADVTVADPLQYSDDDD